MRSEACTSSGNGGFKGSKLFSDPGPAEATADVDADVSSRVVAISRVVAASCPDSASLAVASWDGESVHVAPLGGPCPASKRVSPTVLLMAGLMYPPWLRLLPLEGLALFSLCSSPARP